MSEYKALAEMGIQNPHEISEYTLRLEGSEDVLKIKYKRKKGSYLPNSRKYKFGRSKKTVVSDSGKQEFSDVLEISPFLVTALNELDRIVSPKQQEIDAKREILHEMNHLEKVVSNRLEELRIKLENL